MANKCKIQKYEIYSNLQENIKLLLERNIRSDYIPQKEENNRWGLDLDW